MGWVCGLLLAALFLALYFTSVQNRANRAALEAARDDHRASEYRLRERAELAEEHCAAYRRQLDESSRTLGVASAERDRLQAYIAKCRKRRKAL